MEALELHIQNQGGKIQSSAVFDPFKSSLASTADSMKIPVQKSGVVDSYDPSAVQSEIDKIQNERLVSNYTLIYIFHIQKMLKQTSVTDRDIKVFNANTSSSTSNLKNYLMELDAKE
jgi:hypothetical protein